MPAFLEIVRFECRHQLRSPLFLLIAGTYAVWPILAISGWSSADFANNFNAPIEALRVAAVVGGLFLMFPAVAFIATAITRDYELKTAEQLFVSGVGERTFVLARLTGAFVPVIAIGTLVLIGHGVGVLMPWVDREALGPISVAPYTYAFAVITLPNAVILGVLFVGVAALSRSLAACYVAAIVFFASFIVAGPVATSVLPEDAAGAALADPFGWRALLHETRYWTVAELNRDLPGGWLLVNRAVWLVVAAIALALLVWRYRFNPNPPGALRVWPRRRNALTSAPPPIPTMVRPSFGATSVMAQLLSQLRMDLHAVVRSMPFYTMLTLTLIAVVLVALTGDERLSGTSQIPVTSMVTSFVRPEMTLLLAVILIYLSAELVHRERQTRVAELIDASPFPDGIGVASKILALWFVAAAVLLAAMIAIAIVQTMSQYTNYELGLSAMQLFGGLGVWVALFGVLAVFVQMLAPNKWLGMLVVISVFLWTEFSTRLDFEHFLVRFSLPELTHSDMNGYGHFTLPFVAISTAASAIVAAGAVSRARASAIRCSALTTSARPRDSSRRSSG